MSNVVQLRAAPAPPVQSVVAGLITGFAADRRLTEDVFWLKENAELLGVFCAANVPVGAGDLDPYRTFYAQLPERLRFFPQYYRFLLSLALDLEELGMEGHHARDMCHSIAGLGLADAELSDLQRAEARRLLARRGAAPREDPHLDARLRLFIERSATFAMPNKKAAYELTHIVFYLSDYGRHDPQLSGQAKRSLTYCGILAYLDQNTDLLAEVCTAMHYAGCDVPPFWQETVRHAHRQITLTGDDGQGGLNDAYHEYLVTGWMASLTSAPAFEGPLPEGPLRFGRPAPAMGALRSMSECIYGLGDARSDDWTQMRPHVLPMLGPMGHEVLIRAEQSTDVFAPFFESFARAAKV